MNFSDHALERQRMLAYFGSDHYLKRFFASDNIETARFVAWRAIADSRQSAGGTPPDHTCVRDIPFMPPTAAATTRPRSQTTKRPAPPARKSGERMDDDDYKRALARLDRVSARLADPKAARRAEADAERERSEFALIDRHMSLGNASPHTRRSASSMTFSVADIGTSRGRAPAPPKRTTASGLPKLSAADMAAIDAAMPLGRSASTRREGPRNAPHALILSVARHVAD